MALPLNILLVEDNLADARLTEVALGKTGVNHELVHVENGEACLDYLRRATSESDLVFPDLILMDLNMPGLSGLDVLDELKSDSELKVIPVIILTSSEAEHDVMNCYGRFANLFMTKPASYEDSREMLNLLTAFLSRFVVLPGRYRR